MGKTGVAGHGEGRLAGPCLVKTLANMKLSAEASAQLAEQGEKMLEDMVGGDVMPEVVTPVMIAALAMAIDVGVRVVLVMCNESEQVGALANQLRAVASPLVYASNEPQSWETDLPHIRKHVPTRGVIIACATNARHLDDVRVLLERIDGRMYPALFVGEGLAALLSSRTQARLGELRRLLRRVTMRG